jgi:hypothetical protein
MRNGLLVAIVPMLCGSSLALGADIELRVIIASEVAPGVYGRVEIGGAPPPPLVYAKPLVVVAQSSGPPPQPIYLHVPPGHAKNWSKHCRKYNACGQPVYFVKSDEYKPKKAKKEK